MSDLSPAAQAVLDATTNVFYRPLIERPYCHNRVVAAALRAAADQVVPARLESYGIRYELLRIANELEAA